jgi:hypothetical protein
MPVNDFLGRFGFKADPFESTNADQEPHLGEYFVPPPYFATVMGDVAQPQSHVILAPRGGGKTAQRRMIENRSVEAGGFLCITYDRFDPVGFRRSGSSGWSYHMTQVCRLVLLGVLLEIEIYPSLIDRLSEHQKQVLKFQADRFLNSLSTSEFQIAVDSLKNFGDKVTDFWSRYGGPLAAALSALLSKLGLDNVTVPKTLIEESRRDESLRYHFEQLLQIARVIGYSSTYILIDRVDETSFVSADAEKTFNFIHPLLVDLPTLETEGVAFKFFLWDQIEERYRASGMRPDRVPVYTLQWSIAELETMLAQRLLSYSARRVSSLNQLLCRDIGLDLHRLVVYLAEGSPRDMIRLCKRIIAEQTRTSEESRCLEEAAIWTGVQTFANERSQELFGQHIGELARIGQPTFTISHIASEVFRIGDNAARRKIQIWTNSGVVSKVGEVPNPPNRPSYLFGVTDLRVALAIMTSDDVRLVLSNCAVECPSCETICISDRSDIQCLNCHRQFKFVNANSLLDICQRRR